MSIFMVFLMAVPQATAQRSGLSFIRDAEIEHTLRSYATPLFDAAGLNGNDVAIYIINNRALNAFVAGGQRLFIFTGLLERVDNPGQLKGVIAHETGHIAGGHLARTQDALENASIKAILGYILGAAAIVAGGGQAGSAIILGAQDTATKSFLQYSRTQESSADQAAISYLESTGQSGRGMVDFLDILGSAENRAYGNIPTYYRSHPISSERVAALKRRVESSPYKDVPDTSAEIDELKRIQAKLFGYTRTLAKTLKKYPREDQSIYGRYARAIGYFRYPDMTKALTEIDSLLQEFPDDPYFHELKGQALYENGDVYGALPSLETAIALAPDEPLILTLYGTVLNATGQIADSEKAIAILLESLSYEANNGTTWDQLAIAYSRTGKTGLLAMASAERSLLQGNLQKAIFHAKRAQDFFAPGTPNNLRAEDIITIAGQELRRQ
jgi:predicted Zn-dependent protease